MHQHNAAGVKWISKRYIVSLLKNFRQKPSPVFLMSPVREARIISVQRTASCSSMKRSLYCCKKKEKIFLLKNSDTQRFSGLYLISFHQNTSHFDTSEFFPLSHRYITFILMIRTVCFSYDKKEKMTARFLIFLMVQLTLLFNKIFGFL